MHEKSASEQIDDIIHIHDGWKGRIVSDIRATILAADQHVVEEIKWKMRSRPEGLAVWSHDGIVCFAEIWKDNVKLLFPKGAHIVSADDQFNARLESKDIRTIEYHDGDHVDSDIVTRLYNAAVQLNTSKS